MSHPPVFLGHWQGTRWEEKQQGCEWASIWDACVSSAALPTSHNANSYLSYFQC